MRSHNAMRWMLVAAAGFFAMANCGIAAEEPAKATTRESLTVPQWSVPHAEVKPKVTADPADPAWQQAPARTFTLSLRPDDPATPSVPTVARLLWDEQFLYLRFESKGGDLFSPHTGRDKPHYEGAVVELFLDIVGDARQYYEIEVTPTNQVLDACHTLTADPATGAFGRLTDVVVGRDFWTDMSWTCDGLRTAAQAVPGGWVADIAVPAESVCRRLGRKSFQADQVMRANLLRYDRLLQPGSTQRVFVAMNWAPVLNGCPHISPKAMGTLQLQPAGAPRVP